MLTLAEKNVAAADLTTRVMLVHADAKRLPFDSGEFDVVMSNSIFHHIPDPEIVIAEADRVTAPRGLHFHRDLARPLNEKALLEIVVSYAADATPYQRRLFTDSLHAALTTEEMGDLVAGAGFERETVRMTSDRHWTWAATKS
jgi:ubiquinone/menaquinone biosynthesis C-methylase UbiE